jgi:Na+-driven multidrug efflux pump
MKVANKVVFNTGILYIQLLIGLALGLFTTRIVLDALGETNYGIYVLVAGAVGMLGILNSNMSNTSMRYMAHSLGSGNKEKTLKTFNTTLFLHFIIGSIVVILMEIGGWLLFEYILNIPESKIIDAKIVFHFMVATTFFAVISVPYDAVINSHENLLALSLVDIFGHVLRLGAAIYLIYSDLNLLVLYGFLMLVIQILLRIVKQIYSRVKYAECRIKFRKYVDRNLMKSILSFTGWNLFGSIAAMASTQVRSILINMYFGVALNAAEGISKNASSKVNMVSASMTRAINPQLMKSEGSGNRERMIRITEIGTKFSAVLFALFGIPVLLETNFLLHLWLRNVPDFAVIFCQISLITMLIEKFTFQITHALRAVGEIKKFQITETSIVIFIIPTAYFVFKLGYPPVSIYIIGLIFSLIIVIERLFFLKKITGTNILRYIKNAILPALIPILISLFLTALIKTRMDQSFLRLFTITTFYCALQTIIFWKVGLKTEEKDKLRELFLSILHKLKIRLK